eukprot:6480461-Amphidinium_carterae.1
MALLPSAAECRGLDTLGKIRDWVGLDEDIFDIVDGAAGGFKDFVRNLSVLTPDMLRFSLQSVVVPQEQSTRSLFPLEQAHVGLIWRVARKVTHVASDLLVETFLDVDPFATLPPPGPVKRVDPPAQASSASKRLRMSTL